MEGIARHIHLSEVGSTNSYARQLLKQGTILPEFTLIEADAQTNGRGQQGNHWESEPCCNLTFSIVLHPLFLPVSCQFLLSQSIALSVCEALKCLVQKQGTGLNAEMEFTVKWPNDIYYADLKISGTLIESTIQGNKLATSIIGTGVNVNQQQFHSDAPNPVSLYQILGHETDRTALLTDIVQRFTDYYQLLAQSQFDIVRRQYMATLYRRQGFHLFEDAQGPFSASIADVEPTGHLLLRRTDGTLSRYEFKCLKFVSAVGPRRSLDEPKRFAITAFPGTPDP